MTRNQLHGKKFEDFIKGCGRFPGASDAERSVTASFDIEARFDRKHGLPTSIKATGNSGVALSDARRFWSLNEAFRMIVGVYRQEAEQKVFAQVHEFVLTPEMLLTLRGTVTLNEVTRLHEGIGSAHFPVGDHVNARRWVKTELAMLRSTYGAVKLNPKIDSKDQRRVQCSVPLAALIATCHPVKNHWCHEDRIGDVALPIIYFSGRRKFSD